MSIPEAVGLVLEANIFASNGDTYFLDMGKPIKILDLAKKMIRLYGFDFTFDEEDKNKILITFTGLRLGEKLHEDLTSGNNYLSTSNKFIFKDLDKNYRLINNKNFEENINTVIQSNNSSTARDFLYNFIKKI